MSHRLTVCALGLLLAACPNDTTGAGDDEGSSTGGASTTMPTTTAIPMATMTGGSMSGTDATDATATEATMGTETSDGTTMTSDPPTSTTGDATTGDATTGDPTTDAMTTTGDGTTGDGTTGDGTTGEGTTGDGTTGNMASTGDMTSGDATSGGTTATTGDEECVQTFCGMQLFECGDCIDNDDDGPIDELDVECISPCDDDESSFATGIPGDNIDLCHQDCFFDGNSGAGDDGCEWFLACDPLDPDMGECNLPGGQQCPLMQDPECVENCDVPNGCDCFGCCTVTVDGMEVSILVGADGCSLENFDACPECTPVADCTNECDPEDCELCFGETELPPECEEPTCPDGITSCLADADCPDGFYCQTGCCAEIPS